MLAREVLEIQPTAIILRKDDLAFKKIVDGEILRLIQTGEINAIYKKWFESPIPPNQINLKLPMKKRYAAVQQCADLLRRRAAGAPHELRIRQLYHDREEITVFATLAK